jgi:thiosulfate/3-mercaptopyruvate sulfurtransferase
MVRLMLAAIAIVVLAGGAGAKVPGPLVKPDWLAANHASVTILDVRAEPGTFSREGHIAGSTLVPWSEVRVNKVEEGEQLEDMLPTSDQFTALMRRSGVNAGASIVIASRGLDADDIFMATRLYWQLRYYGHDDVAVLDGGVAAWAAASHAVTKRTRARSPGNWSVVTERSGLLARTSDVSKAVQSRAPALADARPLRDYLGLEFYEHKVAGPGHIPTAKHLDSSLFLVGARPARFRPVQEIREIVTGLGIPLDKPTITYCNTGDWASGAWFVLHELLGNTSTALYDGSMHAWSRSRTRPLIVYKLE